MTSVSLNQNHPGFIFIGKFEGGSVAANERLEGQVEGKGSDSERL